MSTAARSLALCLALLSASVSATPAAALDASLVRLDTARGVKQAFILVKPDKPPTAAVILFAGGHGALGLKSASTMTWGAGNFLVRTREQFASLGFLVAVVDAPTDRQDGMNGEFRMGAAHAKDIAVVVKHLKAVANVPVWVVGTSMGTFSAAGAAINGSGADGLVLTASITRAKPDWKIAGSHPDGVASMPLERFKGPALILSHQKDACDITPAGDSPKLQKRLAQARKVEIRLLTGGRPPESDPCQARSEHGFYGIEDQAVGAIAQFIRGNGG
jgi:pimeloyl-ACP methyl ester carboxylesterase